MGLLRLLSVAAILGATQLSLNNSSPPGPRTGMIVGQVIDSNGQPVGDALVRLYLLGYVETVPNSPNGRVMTDEEGRFFFSELPPGEYSLEASKDGFARGSYGQRQPWGPGQPVSLRENERRTDVTLRVWKFAVIGGTVVDEAGEPVVGVTVRALVKSTFAGRTRFGNLQVIPELVPMTTTDDRGMFRLTQLSPGSYVVLVPSTHTTVPATALQNPNAALRTGLYRAGVPEMTPLGQPRTMQVGEFALMSMNRVLVPPATSADRMQAYRTTFYPAAHTAGTATPVAVKAGEERTDLAISLRPTPALQVSGRLVTPEGSAPPAMMLRLEGDAMHEVVTDGRPNGEHYVGLEAATALSDGRGRFTFVGVAPGNYVLKQGSHTLTRPLNDDTPLYWVTQPVSVGREDITDLVVEMRHEVRVEGRIELQRAAGPQQTPAFFVRGVIFETPFGTPGGFAVEVAKESATFAAVAAGGQYIARAFAASAWFLQSVTLDGKDITDRVIDLQSDATTFVVTYTDRPIKVSGTVTDARGNPATTSTVLVFPADQQHWTGYGNSPRTFRTALPTRTGIYTFDHLPPGEYFVIAVDDAEVDGWRDPARLEALARIAERLSIASGDSLKTLDLRVSSAQ